MTIPRAQRRPPSSLDVIAKKGRGRDEAIVVLVHGGACSCREIAGHFGLHLVAVRRIVRARLCTEKPCN
jgi:hypothetical protein